MMVDGDQQRPCQPAGARSVVAHAVAVADRQLRRPRRWLVRRGPIRPRSSLMAIRVYLLPCYVGTVGPAPGFQAQPVAGVASAVESTFGDTAITSGAGRVPTKL